MTTNDSTTQHARAHRRRGAKLETALLEAVWQELGEVGYNNLTFDSVAKRASTSRNVLYRRWRNRPELVIAAIRQHGPMLSGQVPDTGELRGDVLALLRRVARRLAEIGPETMYGLLSEYTSDIEVFDDLQSQVVPIGAAAMATILERASVRGEVRGAVNPRIARLPVDLQRHEFLVTRAPASEEAILQIVDEIFLPLVARSNEEATRQVTSPEEDSR